MGKNSNSFWFIFDATSFATKVDLACLKSNVNKSDNDKSKTGFNNSHKSKSDVDKLDVDQPQVVLVDLKKPWYQ